MQKNDDQQRLPVVRGKKDIRRITQNMSPFFKLSNYTRGPPH